MCNNNGEIGQRKEVGGSLGFICLACFYQLFTDAIPWTINTRLWRMLFSHRKRKGRTQKLLCQALSCSGTPGCLSASYKATLPSIRPGFSVLTLVHGSAPALPPLHRVYSAEFGEEGSIIRSLPLLLEMANLKICMG